jgi:hypothetical protein
VQLLLFFAFFLLYFLHLLPFFFLSLEVVLDQIYILINQDLQNHQLLHILLLLPPQPLPYILQLLIQHLKAYPFKFLRFHHVNHHLPL